MKSLKMNAIINIILILVAVMTVSGMPQYIIKSLSVNNPTVPVTCLPLGTLCVKSKLPCCILSYQNSYRRLGKVPTTCFEFGKGICQINSSIENFKEYGKLIKQRNETNFEELRTQYWNSTQSAYICPQKITTYRNEESLKELIEFQRTNCTTNDVKHY